VDEEALYSSFYPRLKALCPVLSFSSPSVVVILGGGLLDNWGVYYLLS